MANKKKLTTRDLQRSRASEAMPAVKRVIHQYGRAAVANCLNKLKAHEKQIKQLDALKKQVAEMEKIL